MRAPVDTIPAPPFPVRAQWINVAMLRLDQMAGSPLLVEFFDVCRPNSLRTLPYVRAWHERYRERGLRVLGVHCPGFAPSTDPDTVRAALERLEVSHPVLLDGEFELWQAYGNLGWPARYLFGADHMLVHYHYGERGYRETELAIQELVGAGEEPLRPLRPEDADDAELVVPWPADQEGAWVGRYGAGAVWGVFEGSGELVLDGRRIAIAHSGAHRLVEHPHHTEATLGELALGEGLVCVAVCFEAGLAP